MENPEGHGRTPSELAAMVRVFDAAVERILLAEGVYAVDSYGWVDHDDIDQRYFGLAIWQTDRPFEPDFSVLMGGGVVRYAPTVRDEVLIRNGEDFVAVMDAARRSMGNALVRWQAVDSQVIGTSDEFWENYSICTMLLAIASDRMRDFLVMALENVVYNSKGTEDSQKDVIKRAIEKVPGLADYTSKIQQYKVVRNRIVHEMATLAARRSIDSLKEQRRHAIARVPVEIWEPSFEELQAAQEVTAKEFLISKEIELMKNWYRCLIEASNLIFAAEHANRRKI